MNTREIVCEHYEFEGGCSKGKEGTFRKACQTCKLYKAKRGTAPARKNLKREKTKKIKEHDMERMMRNYED